ncbi:hypothetical protein GCM10010440_35480 [Kitasatospora cinereorecta]
MQGMCRVRIGFTWDVTDPDRHRVAVFVAPAARVLAPAGRIRIRRPRSGTDHVAVEEIAGPAYQPDRPPYVVGPYAQVPGGDTAGRRHHLPVPLRTAGGRPRTPSDGSGRGGTGAPPRRNR